MPRKKIHKVKTRAYLNKLLDDAGLSDKKMAEAIKEGIASDNPAERSKALDMAGQWKGFADVDKRAGDDIEPLPLANVKLEDLDRLANRCSYCKYKKFEPLRTGKPIEPNAPGNAIDKVEPVLNGAYAPIDCSELLGKDHYPVITEAVKRITENINEQNPQEKAD